MLNKQYENYSGNTYDIIGYMFIALHYLFIFLAQHEATIAQH